MLDWVLFSNVRGVCIDCGELAMDLASEKLLLLSAVSLHISNSCRKTGQDLELLG